jgi:hypothetical protein
MRTILGEVVSCTDELFEACLEALRRTVDLLHGKEPGDGKTEGVIHGEERGVAWCCVVLH